MIYHILNGDALKEQLPESITGTFIITRECLVEGDVRGDSLEELFTTRAQFIEQHYGISKAEYHIRTNPEFEQILNLPDNAIVNLWFEEDLFCQVNLWFVAHLLVQNNNKLSISLVLPNKSNKYNFAGMSKAMLSKAFQNKKPLSLDDLKILQQLWLAYQKTDIEKIVQFTIKVNSSLAFIKNAIQALKGRYPENGSPGIPEQTILDIIDKKKTKDFGKIFQAFCEKAPEYGFGDLQVKRIYNNVIAKAKS